MPRVVVGVIAICSMLGLVAWSYSGGVQEVAFAAIPLPAPALAYVPAGMVPFKQPMPANPDTPARFKSPVRMMPFPVGEREKRPQWPKDFPPPSYNEDPPAAEAAVDALKQAMRT